MEKGKWKEKEGASALRRRPWPRSATRGVGRACVGWEGGARAALAAKRRPGARGREGEREREERFAAMIATDGEEKREDSVGI